MFNDHMPWGYQVTFTFTFTTQRVALLSTPQNARDQSLFGCLFGVFQGLFKGLKGDDGGIGLTDLIKYL